MELDSTALPFRVLTLEDANAFIQRLRAVYDTIYREKKTDILAVLEDYLLEEEYRHITTYAQDKNISLQDKQQLQEFIEGLLTAMSELELLTLRLAFQPRHTFVAAMVEWFRHNGPGMCRIQMVFDEDIVGGLVVEYGGKIYDYSLRKGLEKITI